MEMKWRELLPKMLKRLTGVETTIQNLNTYGLGIKKIEQTVVSSNDQGVNVITFTLTDGTVSKMEIRNGSKGEMGDTDNVIEAIKVNGVLQPVVDKTANITIKTNGDSDAGVVSDGKVYLTDQSTSKGYVLKVVNGKLTMEETASESGEGHIGLLDEITQTYYKLKVVNGDLTMEEVT